MMSKPKLLMPAIIRVDNPAASRLRDSSQTSRKTTPTKTRVGKPKVKTGCLTCRIRRVKCDETKPECERCTATGRKCDGYVHNTPKATVQASHIVCRNLSGQLGTPAELRALEFFHHKTANQLSSYFDAGFWTQKVFQASHAEDSVRHAMITVATLAEQREVYTGRTLVVKPIVVQGSIGFSDHLKIDLSATKGSVGKYDKFAFAQYIKAIGSLASRLQAPDAPVEVALLVCILFVCVEFLRGDPEHALKHFKSGMNIMMGILSKQNSYGAQKRIHGIDANILAFFNRLELLSMLFGNDSEYEYPIDLTEAVPAGFQNIVEARDSLIHVMNLSLRFIRSMKYRKYQGLVSVSDTARQSALSERHRCWESAFDALLVSRHMTDRDLNAAKLLRLHLIVVRIWTGVALIPEECKTDAWLPEFETAVILAEAIRGVAATKDQRQELNSSSFLFDMEIISPLYFVCLNCRHPVVRRRATAVLKMTMRREGLWDSYKIAAISERLMAIEEKNLTRLDGSELPKEKDRIHISHIQSEPGMYPEKHIVTYYSKPQGLDRGWYVWREELLLNQVDALED